MANIKITELAELTAPTTDDLLEVVDDPAGSPISKKISISNLLKSPGIIGGTTPAAGAFTTLSASGLITATGGQIAFPATAVPSADANTLDDYEEGTYTATLTCGTSGTITIDSSMDTLSYTKTGNSVTVNGRLYVASVSSPVGSLRVSLPFVIGYKTELSYNFASYVRFFAINAIGGLALMISSQLYGAAYAAIMEQTTTIELDDVANHVLPTSQFIFGFTYFV